ncbi:hypothetical protein C0995_008126, partial [Termitomyces sp. Mi166
MQASTTLVHVIRTCLKAGDEGQIGGPTAHAIADAFAKHYNHIKQCPDFGQHFQAYFAYDIYICHAYLQKNGNLRVEDWHAK